MRRLLAVGVQVFYEVEGFESPYAVAIAAAAISANNSLLFSLQQDEAFANLTAISHAFFGVDECAASTDNCAENGTCIDTDSSFTCQCNAGFYTLDDGLTCHSDSGVDECAEGLHNCHYSATCTDTTDSFTCVCNDGFEGNGAKCFKSCNERDAGRCHGSAFCEDPGFGGQCVCPEGSVGDGLGQRFGGSGCSRESWAVKLSLDLGQSSELPRLTSSGQRLFHWEEDRSALSDLLFRNSTAEKPSWFDTSMFHTVIERRFVSVFALFHTQMDAELAMTAFWNNTLGSAPALFRINNPIFTSTPKVATFVSQTSEAEIQVSPTGMDVQNVYFQPNCMTSGCWVIDLIYTTGEDNFNVFYIPKAIGNDTLSFDFDYTVIPHYAIPYDKSPLDTFLPLNFPCGLGSDTYVSEPGPHIPNRVSACCIEEFTELYRAVDSFTADPKVAEVLGDSRGDHCASPMFCAVEGDICNCTGTVQFGNDYPVFYQESDGQIECTSEAFGAPSQTQNISRVCSCSPARKIWSKSDMPQSALYGNFSGMNGLARVDFKAVEDPFKNQYIASVYLDEVTLRREAGILTGSVGVAHSIDTFIGFANFKPTATEFLDMFAAQTNIHLETTRFFTVSAYGENQHTFLEYVNLRLVAIYDEDDGFVGDEPFSFDVYHLRTASLGPYPPSPATGNITLGSDSTVFVTEESDGGYIVHYFLTGLHAAETQGGLHIHEGTSCESHAQVLGHYFSTPTDPWTTVWTKDAGSTVAQGSVYVANPGFPLADNDRHAFVVHEQSGLRIACGTLYDVAAGITSRTSPQNAAHYLQVTFTLGAQYQPMETGIIPIDSVLVSKGDFISSSATLDTRFHACSKYLDGSLPRQALFDSRFPNEATQTCAPNVTMCHNPQHIPDQFVSFNVPLGVDWLPSPSNDLVGNVFVDMVVSVVDTQQIVRPASSPNLGSPAEQMKTTLTASIPVVEGGTYIFCDRITVNNDLLDVANVDLVLGSAGFTNEFSRLFVAKDIASQPFEQRTATYIESDSIEAGLMTLVVKGNASYFARAADSSLEVEDVVTIHVMEPEPYTTYQQVLSLLRIPGEDVTTDQGFAINGAFLFTVDNARQRVHLDPTSELLQLCPFRPVRPSLQDAFPSTCITRRDIRARGFPALVGKNATAIELPSADVQLQDPRRSDVAEFMQLVLNPSQYSAELGRNFSYLIAQKYQINGRYNRAFWINPGYEWSPLQTGNQDVFTLSQQIVLFAIITLNEGVAGRRRMLLQTSTGNANTNVAKDAGAEFSGQRITFDTSPRSMMADAFSIPEDLVAVFRVQMHLTQQQGCMDLPALRQSLRSFLDDSCSATASAFETVQVMSVSVDASGLQCNTRRTLSSRRAMLSAATASVEMMVVFSPSMPGNAGIDLIEFGDLPGIISISVLQVADVIQLSTDDSDRFLPTNNVPPSVVTDISDGDSDFAPSTPAPLGDSNSPTVSTGMAVGVGAAVVVIAGAYAAYRTYQRHSSETEVEVLECVDIHSLGLQAELTLPIECDDPLNLHSPYASRACDTSMGV